VVAVFARLSSYQGAPVPTQGDITPRAREILEQIRDLAGFRGLFLLVDRATGKSVSLTLWQDEQAMRASESLTNRIRQESAAREGERIVRVERFEVGFQHLKE
jgi:heme-degrading monooxygenase HmoA